MITISKLYLFPEALPFPCLLSADSFRVHRESLPLKGTQTFPKLQIALGFRVLRGKTSQHLPFFSVPPLPSHMYIHGVWQTDTEVDLAKLPLEKGQSMLEILS